MPFKGESEVPSKLTRWVLERLVRPIVVPVGFVLGKIYDFFFWESNVRLSQEHEKQLTSEIQQNLPFLFSEYAGIIVPIESIEEPVSKSLQHPRPFDYAVVIVAVNDLLFRFIRGRGEFNIQVTKRCAPKNWGELPWILYWLGWRENMGEPRSFMSMEDVAKALRPRMDLLLEEYSERRYSEMRQRVTIARAEERADARQLSAELNRKLRG
jgi:hypothetical protein